MKAPRPLLLPRKSCLRGVPVSTVDNCSIHRKQYLPCILDNEPQVVLVRKFDGVLDVENRLRRNADNRDVPLFAGQAERRLHVARIDMAICMREGLEILFLSLSRMRRPPGAVLPIC